MPQFQTWQEQQVAAGRHLANLPLEPQEAARTIYAASEAMNRPADPVEAAIGDVNACVRGMKPPSLAQQLSQLGIEVEPEPEPVSTTSTTEA